MYQKILDEAIVELKESEFASLYNDEQSDEDFVKDCQIETDMEIRIPDDYISSITERLSLYKELDNINNEHDIVIFSNKLSDRFGRLPSQTLSLINTVRLRWLAKKIGFVRLYLKNNRMTGYFVGGHDSPFFLSLIHI